MKAKIVDGQLQIDLIDLVDSLTKEQQGELARHLVGHESLFSAVLECVTDESRFGYYFQEDGGYGNWHFSPQTVLELREKLIPLMDTVARGIVEQALNERNHAVAEGERYKCWAWKLYHRWPDDHFMSRPHWPEWMPTPTVSKDEVDGRFEKEVTLS